VPARANRGRKDRAAGRGTGPRMATRHDYEVDREMRRGTSVFIGEQESAGKL